LENIYNIKKGKVDIRPCKMRFEYFSAILYKYEWLCAPKGCTEYTMPYFYQCNLEVGLQVFQYDHKIKHITNFSVFD